MTAAVPVIVEYLYTPWMYEDNNGCLGIEVREFRILKRTAKRILFADWAGRTKSVDRGRLEHAGSVWVRDGGGYHVYTNRSDAEPTPRETPETKIRRLRTEAAAVHPDRGGDAAEFRSAYALYQRAAASAPEVTR